jgi:hypothetical protein
LLLADGTIHFSATLHIWSMQDTSGLGVSPSDADSDGVGQFASVPNRSKQLLEVSKRKLAADHGTNEPTSKRTKQSFTEADHDAASTQGMPNVYDDNCLANATDAELETKDVGHVIATGDCGAAAASLALETTAKPGPVESGTDFGSTCNAGMAIIAELKTQLHQDSDDILPPSIQSNADGSFDCIDDIQAHMSNSCATVPSPIRTSSGPTIDDMRDAGLGAISVDVNGASPYRPFTGDEAKGSGAVENALGGTCDTGGDAGPGETDLGEVSSDMRVAHKNDGLGSSTAARIGVIGSLSDVRRVGASFDSIPGADAVNRYAGVPAVLGPGVGVDARHSSATAVIASANKGTPLGARHGVEPNGSQGETGDTMTLANTGLEICTDNEARAAVGASVEPDAASGACHEATSALVVNEDASLVFAPDESGGAGYADSENFGSIGDQIAPVGSVENYNNKSAKGAERPLINSTEAVVSNQCFAASVTMAGYAESKEKHDVALVYGVSSSPGLNLHMAPAVMRESDGVAQVNEDADTQAALAAAAAAAPVVSRPVPSIVRSVSVPGGPSAPETLAFDHAFVYGQAISVEDQSAAGTPRTESAHPCGECGIAFYNLQALEYHTEHFHGSSIQNLGNGTPARPRPFPCLMCGRAFLRTGDLNRHRNVVHGRVRKSICSICKAGFGHAGDRNRHEIRVHERGEFHQCELCAATFGSKAAHVAHLKIHAKRMQSGTPFGCTHCSKSFASEAERDTHSSEAHIVNKHSCRFELCTETFPTARSLKAHVQSKHEQVIRCDLCPATFRKSAELLAHKGKRHSSDASKPT